GGMGTKADDLCVSPLCRKCPSELPAGVNDFEEKHGSQRWLLIRFLVLARTAGVRKWNAYMTERIVCGLADAPTVDSYWR
ncbi:hypothetical protein ACNITU_26970, partial [Escherichia coli]